MLYLLGDDTYGAREYISEQAQKLEAELRWLDEEELKEKPFSDWLGQSQGLFGRHLPVVRDPSQMPAKLQADIIKAIKDIEHDCIFWDRAKPDKRTTLYKTLKPSAQEFNYLDTPALIDWLNGVAKESAGTIQRPAAQILIDRLGPDRWRLQSELKRLLLINLEVTSEIVEREIALSLPAEIFSTLDALVKGDQQSTVRNIEILLEQGNSEFYLLSMLAYQFRTLLIVKAGLDENKSSQQIARQGKVHPFVVQKSISVANRFTKNQLLNILTKISATDFAIKQGKVDARTGLLMLVIGLLPQPQPTNK